MKICLIVNSEIPERLVAMRQLCDILVRQQQQVFLLAPLMSRLELPASPYVQGCASETEAVIQSDVVISVGGDGTMLHTARLTAETGKPILGINVGKLGFLADTQLPQAEEAIRQLIGGQWETESRFTLKARAAGSTEDFFALNEFLFTRQSAVSMITLEVFFGDQKVNKYWADGLIVATPTGSTAYNLSAGGPILLPEVPVMVITPVCPHALTTRSLVMPANRSIRIRAVPPEQQILFSNDGKICNLTENQPLDIQIERSEFDVRLVKLPGRNYFETLREKLMWGMDLRD